MSGAAGRPESGGFAGRALEQIAEQRWLGGPSAAPRRVARARAGHRSRVCPSPGEGLTRK